MWEAAMDWVLIGTSGIIALILAIWTVVREDVSVTGRGRHRRRRPAQA
ncbi:hypothetical protein GCM10009849_07990 [Sinomonas flava]|uniref:Uncharacterized protein n=1 Tax=Sinomonas flava TaxID=496857 RepID=A0ABP5NH97_9MICC